MGKLKRPMATLFVGVAIFFSGMLVGKRSMSAELLYREQAAAMLGDQNHILNKIRNGSGSGKDQISNLQTTDWVRHQLPIEVEQVLNTTRQSGNLSSDAVMYHAVALYADRLEAAYQQRVK
jgi:hypothetical protein